MSEAELFAGDDSSFQLAFRSAIASIATGTAAASLCHARRRSSRSSVIDGVLVGITGSSGHDSRFALRARFALRPPRLHGRGECAGFQPVRINRLCNQVAPDAVLCPAQSHQETVPFTTPSLPQRQQISAVGDLGALALGLISPRGSWLRSIRSGQGWVRPSERPTLQPLRYARVPAARCLLSGLLAESIMEASRSFEHLRNAADQQARISSLAEHANLRVIGWASRPPRACIRCESSTSFPDSALSVSV